MENGVKLEARRAGDETLFADEWGDQWTGYLPPVVSDWLGLSEDDGFTDNPIVSNDGSFGFRQATYVNDSLGWSFQQIANGLRKTYDL
jgi:hypothetical protein